MEEGEGGQKGLSLQEEEEGLGTNGEKERRRKRKRRGKKEGRHFFAPDNVSKGKGETDRKRWRI